MDKNRFSLHELLKDNPKAGEYFDSLHPSVQHRLHERSGKIATIEDLYAYANNAMTDALKEVKSAYEDSGNFED